MPTYKQSEQKRTTGQDSSRRIPVGRVSFDGDANVGELGAFVTIEEGSNTGGVNVIVEFHDGKRLCSDEFASGASAAMFSHLILGAIQLHDPEAIIVVQDDRRVSEVLPATSAATSAQLGSLSRELQSTRTEPSG